MHEPAVAPLADVEVFSRSTIAGVLITAGWDATGTCRSIVRVQPTTAANAAVLAARVRTNDAFMLGPPMGLDTPTATGKAASLTPSAGREIAGRWRVFQRPARRLRSHRQEVSMARNKVEGEGSYTGSKDYNERTRKFIDSGKVKDAARDAEPKSEEESHAMQKAERIGRSHAKEEDPALRHQKKIPDDPNYPKSK